MRILFIFLFLFFSCEMALGQTTLKVGSKTFTESYLLAELISQVAEDTGLATVERKFGLGGTGISYQAIINGEVDVYPDYTGTIAEEILKKPSLKSVEEIRQELETFTPLTMSNSLGFNNSYGIAVHKDLAEKHNLQTISDLADFSHWKVAISNEFNTRQDGFVNMAKRYGLYFKNVIPMEHALIYEAFANRKVEVVSVYKTDAKISRYNMKILKDNLNYFPIYNPILLVRKDFVENRPQLWRQLQDKLVGKISEDKMIALNSLAEIDEKSPAVIAAEFLGKDVASQPNLEWQKFWQRTLEHMLLVMVSLICSVVIGIPLGVFAYKSERFGQSVLLATGLLQTIPSLALLCFMIPLLGTGMKPALMALFLYGLLPIVRNTHAGLTSVDNKLIDAATAINLTDKQQMRWVLLPLASINIMAGVKTSAVINVGTATIAALIGAGGYGAYIIEGLTRNNMLLLLKGAIPAAVLAILMHGLFEISDRIFVPKGLRL